MSKPKDKGNLLEYAAHQIEAVLLESFPQLSGESASVERNKIITVGGIRHEADLWITVAAGTPYEAYHIIECKNWKDPVGTGEIDKLQQKRMRVGASKALLIAPRFTTDARKLAESIGIQLYAASEEIWPSIATIMAIGTELEFREGYKNQIAAHFRDSEDSIISDTELCYFKGIPIPLDELAASFVRNRSKVQSRLKLEGVHRDQDAFTCEFDLGELIIDKKDVAQLSIDCAYTLFVHHAKLTVKFSVEGRGGFLRLEYPQGAFGNQSTEIEIVTLDKPKNPKLPPA